jgi:hypothetical protein
VQATSTTEGFQNLTNYHGGDDITPPKQFEDGYYQLYIRSNGDDVDLIQTRFGIC